MHNVKKKWIQKFAAVLLIVTTMTTASLLATLSFAEDGDDDDGFWSGAKEVVSDIVGGIEGRGKTLANSLNGVGDANKNFYVGLDKIVENLSKNPSEWASGEPNRIAKNIAGTLKAVGSVLVILFYGIGVFKTSYSYIEHRQWGTTFKGLLRLGIAWSFAAVAPDLAYYIFDIGTSLVNSVVGSFGNVGNINDAVGFDNAKKEIEELGLLFDGRWTLMATFWVVKQGLHLLFIVMLVYVMMRFFKMMIYIAVSPLPMAALASESTQSHAIAFVRALAGVALEGLVIILAIKIFQVVVSNSDGRGLIGTTYVPFSDGDSEGQQAIKAYLMTVMTNAVACCTVVIGADKMVQKAFGT